VDNSVDNQTEAVYNLRLNAGPRDPRVIFLAAPCGRRLDTLSLGHADQAFVTMGTDATTGCRFFDVSTL
jgi:hypothetical protein